MRKEEDIDFDMNFNHVMTSIGNINKICYFSAFFSKTEILFYITCVITTILIYLFV